jgi:hypothetical protein
MNSLNDLARACRPGDQLEPLRIQVRGTAFAREEGRQRAGLLGDPVLGQRFKSKRRTPEAREQSFEFTVAQRIVPRIRTGQRGLHGSGERRNMGSHSSAAT